MIAALAASGRQVGITGVGAYVPERVLTNDDLAQMVETSDEWITERTGIKERRIAASAQAASDLALPAARQALERAGLGPQELDLVIVATSTPDVSFAATASILADRLGATEAGAYDLAAACTGFVYALTQAYGSVATGLAQRVLVVGAETLSKVTNWSDRSTCILWGDGAGAAVVEAVGEPGFLGFELGSDGSGAGELCVPAGGSRRPATDETVAANEHTLTMNGREVFKFATRVMVSSAAKLLDACALSVDAVDLYVPHQANRRIIDYAARQLGLSPERVFVNLDRYGNTSAASIPLCLAEAAEAGRLQPGMTVLMTGIGGGLSWGSAAVTWTDGARA